LLAVALVKIQFVYEHRYGKFVARFVDNSKMTMVMTMSWCLLFWGQWEIFDTHFVKRVIVARAILAVMISAFAVAMTLLLDFIADHQKSNFGKISNRLLIFGFGLAMAFAWEQTFDVSLENMAAGTKKISEAQAKMVLAIFLVAIVAPAWALYILPKTLALEEELEEELEGGEDEEKELGAKGVEKLADKDEALRLKGVDVPMPDEATGESRPKTPAGAPAEVVGAVAIEAK